MTKPAIVVVDDDPTAFAGLETELAKRYGADYDVVAGGSAEAAVGVLEQFRDAGRPVALVLADLLMTPITGIDLLVTGRELHPTARRAVLVDWVDVRRSKRRLVEASALGQIDCAIRKPVGARDERFHQTVTELLREWVQVHDDGRAVVKVIGDNGSPRCNEVKDLLARYGVPFRYYRR